MYLGIDVSVHNGNINVKQIRDAGYKRIIIRAGYGKNNIDQKYVVNAEACKNLSVDSGIYWFSYALNEAMAAAEAEYAVAAALKYWNACPIAFDLEYDTVRYARTKGVEITKELATKMAIAFLQIVARNGFTPVLYTNKDYAKNYFDIPAIEAALGQRLFIWYARYNTSLSESEKDLADIWQKSSKGKVAGISGNVDINEFYTYFDSVRTEEATPTTNINILNFQKAANKDGYKDQAGNALKEDGIDGPKTQYVRKNINLKTKRIGIIHMVGSKGDLVTYWQKRLCEMGFVTDIDGKYGKDTRAKTIEMQKAFGLNADGIAGYNTLSTSFYN